MLGKAAATLFVVITSVLGFASVYNQIDAGTKQRMVRSKNLTAFGSNAPLVIYISAILILLRWLSISNPNQQWLFTNILAVILVYSNLLAQNIASFVVIQLVGTLLIFGTGAASLTALPLYLFACLTVFAERWYGPKLTKSHFIYIVPSLIVGATFWTYVYFHHSNLSLLTTLVNFVAFVWAYLALWDYDQYQRRDQQVVARLTHEVEYDGLTQARNWVTFQRDFTNQYEKMGDQPLGLIVLDIDHFKDVNDSYGHLVGNRTLMTVASALMQSLHTCDVHYELYRTGGEEFAILLPNTDQEKASAIVHDCQKKLRGLPIHSGNGSLNITASFGVAMASKEDGSSTAVFKRADHYLYESKRAGRDRVTVE